MALSYATALAVLVAAGPLVVAQAMPSTGEEWIKGITGLGTFAVVCWYGWFVTCRTIPQMQKDHREERKEERDFFAGELKTLEQQIDRACTAIGR